MDAKLKELQDKKVELYGAIKELRDAGPESWVAEQHEKWEQVNQLYDANERELEERRKQVANSEAVQKRLGEIEEELRTSSITKQNTAREHGFLIEREDTKPTAADRALSLQAWMLANNRRSDKISSRHQQACFRTGVDWKSPELNIRLDFRAGDPAWMCAERQELRKGHYLGAEYRDLNITTDTEGKETIPTGFMAELERRLLAFGGPRSVCRVLRTASGNPMSWPTVDDTSNTGVLLAEATTIGSSVDPTFGSVPFTAYKYSSKAVLVSAELIDDSAFDLAAEIGSMLGERLGRIIGQHTTTGTGTDQPQGIVVGATTTPAGSATAITEIDIINLVHALDPAYRVGPNVGFMMHDAKVATVRKFREDGATGQFLWQPGLQAGVPDRLIGYPITINQHMASATPENTQRSILFGDFSKFVIRDAADVRFYRLEERYRDLDQTGFIAFMRVDSRIIQPNAIKALLHST